MRHTRAVICAGVVLLSAGLLGAPGSPAAASPRPNAAIATATSTATTPTGPIWVDAPSAVSPTGQVTMTRQLALPAPTLPDSASAGHPVIRPLIVYSLPVSGDSHPSGSTNDYAYEFHYGIGAKGACVHVNGTVGGVATTTTILYFNLWRDIGVAGWDNDGRQLYYFALDNQVHYACWPETWTFDNSNYAVAWEEARYRINNGQIHVYYTEYYQS